MPRTNIINAYLDCGLFPEENKTAKVLPIH